MQWIFWFCLNQKCATCGPSDDEDGTKWNALMGGARHAAMDPPAGLLLSMATCIDHGFGAPDAGELDYRKPTVPEYQRSMLSDMRKVWDEVMRHGYWCPEREADYESLVVVKPTEPPAGTARVRSHPMPDIITGPGIYQMRNGDFVAIMWTEHACDYPWRDAFREGWTASGRYCIGQITPFDIVRRVADLPEVENG